MKAVWGDDIGGKWAKVIWEEPWYFVDPGRVRGRGQKG